MSWIASGISALGSLFGSAASSGLSYKAQSGLMAQQNKYNNQMFDRYLEMSNTAHQREVSDLRAAGLNPLLSANSGASSGVGSSTTGSSFQAQVDDPVAAAMNNKLMRAQIQNFTANSAKTNAEAKTQENIRKNLDADTALKKTEKVATDTKLPYETRKLAAEAKNVISQSLLNDEIRKYTGYNSNTARINANANKVSADANRTNAAGSYYYNTHRALGFSESESYGNTPDSESGSMKFGPYSYGKSRTNAGFSRSRSRTY